RSAVRQPVLLDIVAIGLEQHVSAAMFADRLRRPLDHPVALAGLLVFHLAGRGNLEALFGARFGLQLGHLALLIDSSRGRPTGRNMLLWGTSGPRSGCSGLSINRRHGSPYWPGDECAALWQRRARHATARRRGLTHYQIAARHPRSASGAIKCLGKSSA